MAFRIRLILFVAGILLFAAKPQNASAVIRDGGIDPANLGKGEWIFSVADCTNKLGGHITSVTNEASMFQYFKSIGIRYVIIKMATGSTNYGGCYASPHQVTANLCNIAHANGVWVFGYTRSYGSDIAGEAAAATSCFNNGADGFVFDAEAEWESNRAWIGTNGPALAWQLCSTVRATWPNKFIAHAPMPIIYLHSSFPYKEFGYWCDAVMPQIYHFSAAGLKGSPSAAINWSDVNWRTWQNSLYSLPVTTIDGLTVNWTNAIKPLTPLQDVYGPTIAGGLICNGSAGAMSDIDVMEFIDYSLADPNTVTSGGYRGINFWRADLHGAQQYTYIKEGSSGNYTNIVNNIVMDDAAATVSGGWVPVKVFASTTGTPSYYGDAAAGGTDTSPFGTNYWKISKGAGTSFMQFTPKVLTAGDYRIYQWHPNRSDASATIPVVVKADGETDNATINQTTNAGNWSLIGTYPFAVGTNGYVRFTDGFSESSGVAMVDGFKMVFVPPVAVPLAPTNLVAGPLVGSQVTLTWSDNSANETGFVIYRGTTSGGPYSSIGFVTRNVTTFTDINAPVGPTYYYVVRGTNYLGLSPNSNQASPLVPPVITKQPQSITVGQFSPASFTVTATGGPLTYEWRRDGNPIGGTTNISGVASSNLVFASAQLADASSNYSVFISNAAGSTNSVSVALTVATVPPSIITQPVSQTVGAGSTVVFGVVANGTQPLVYQWKKGATVLSDGAGISGATTAALTLSGVLKASEGSYSVTITNLYGNIVSSNATLTVNDPAITSSPVDQVADAGQTVVFTAAAAGTPTLSYLWKKNGTNMVNGGKISGANTTSLTITNVLFADVADYTMQVSNSLGTAVSAPAHLYVNDPIFLSQPLARTNIAGTTATFSVSAYGTTAISYIWKKNGNVLNNGGNVFGATTSTLTISNVSQLDATIYTVVISNISSAQISGPAALVVIDPPAIIQQPQSQTVVRDTNVLFTVGATGTQPLSYQWRFKGTNIPGATASSYALPNVQTNKSGDYRVFISNAGGSILSSNAILEVNVPFEIFNLVPTTRANSVIINWGTTSNSTTQVEYGLTPAMGYFSPRIDTPVTNHTVLLTSLKPDTTYYFRAISQIGPVVISSNSTFFTSSSLVVDNPFAYYDGLWTYGTSSADKYGTYYQYAQSTTNAATSSATYTPDITISGKYDVYTWYGWQTTRSTNTPMIIYGAETTITSRVNQTTNTGSWQLLAKGMKFNAGGGGYARVANDTGETNRIVVADAFRWQYNLEQDIRTDGTVPDWWSTFYFGTTNINAQSDADGDGYSTSAEYIMGTVPNDPSSKFSFTIQRLGSDVVQATFSPCEAGRNYELRYRTDLGVLNWTNKAAGSLVLSNGFGVITATNATTLPAFYRLSVNLAP